MSEESPDYHPPANLEDMEIEERVIYEIRRRRELGRYKYGKSMERGDLTPSQWAQHLVDELMDSVVYGTRLIRDLKEMEKKNGVQETPHVTWSPEC